MRACGRTKRVGTWALSDVLALTQGDPAGVGPEIWVRLWHQIEGRRVLVGDLAVIEDACQRFAPSLTVSTGGPTDSPSHICVQDTQTLSAPVSFGEVSAQAGRSSFASVETAVEGALNGQYAGVVTAPIHKSAWQVAGIPFPGHTELLADRAGCDVAMCLANDELATVLVSAHCSLVEAIQRINHTSVYSAIQWAELAGQQLRGKSPRIAVAGLNPHAGEGGQFGSEEIHHIAPAIAQAQQDGLDVLGPFAPDTVFMRARAGEFDVVVAMYHDQGLIPVKYLGVEDGVNLTLGLPFVRTSPDHGTAFEIAGQGVANVAATRYAYQKARAILSL